MSEPATLPGVVGADSSRRGEILRAASRLFDAVGYHRASLSELAKAVDLAKATLYHHFRSKDELLYDIHQVLIAEMIRRHDARAAEGASAVAMLRGVVVDVLGLMETDRGAVRVFFENERELNETQRRHVRASRERYNAMVEAAFVQGAEAGDLRRVDPVLATRALFGMCNWAYQWYRPDGPLTSQGVADQLWSFFIDGVAARRTEP